MPDIEETIELKIICPTGTAYDQDVSFVKVQTVDGQRGILPNHSAYLSELVSGELEVYDDKERDLYFVPRGIIHVEPQKVVILAPYIEHVSEIDLDRAKASEKRALEELKQKHNRIEIKRAQLALRKSRERIEIIEKEKLRK